MSANASTFSWRKHINLTDLKLAFSTTHVPEALPGSTDDFSHLIKWLKLVESYSDEIDRADRQTSIYWPGSPHEAF
jgi:hypothetical protein